jgi:hypothetical protein
MAELGKKEENDGEINVGPKNIGTICKMLY